MAFWHVDMRSAPDWDEIIPNPMSVHYDEPTRVRVFREQLQDTVMESVNRFNYLFHVEVYLKLGSKLRARFPDSGDRITEATLQFWQRIQTRLKILLKENDGQ